MYLSILQEVLTQKSVRIVRIICFRGSGKPLLQDKTTPHAKPVYITELYIWQA